MIEHKNTLELEIFNNKKTFIQKNVPLLVQVTHKQGKTLKARDVWYV